MARPNIRRTEPAPTSKEVFDQIVKLTVVGEFSIEQTSFWIADAVMRAVYEELLKLGLWADFQHCAHTTKHIIFGMAAHKLADLKHIDALRRKAEAEDDDR
jgi:uncharacterized protein YwlG (UPF0340 family)